MVPNASRKHRHLRNLEKAKRQLSAAHFGDEVLVTGIVLGELAIDVACESEITEFNCIEHYSELLR